MSQSLTERDDDRMAGMVSCYDPSGDHRDAASDLLCRRDDWVSQRQGHPHLHVESNCRLERKKPYVNHYSLHILDRDWGHVTIKISGHPPFPAQVILNGLEYVACQARISFTKEGNCFTAVGNTSGFAKIAEGD